MMTPEEVSEYNEEALIADGLDEAIIGVAERINLGPVAAYSVEYTPVYVYTNEE